MTLQPMALSHDGTALTGQVACPDGERPFAAVLVMHSGQGIGAFNLETAQRLAALGYLAVAIDLFGAGVEPARAYAALQAQPDLARERIIAWFDAVAARPDVDAARIAAIGHSFGGLCALDLARSGADVKAVVSFHGTLTTHAPARPGAIRGVVTAYCGAKDRFAPLDHVAALQAEMDAAGASLQLMLFTDGEHGFTNKAIGSLGLPGITYNPVADAVSWAGTVALFEETLKR